MFRLLVVLVLAVSLSGATLAGPMVVIKATDSAGKEIEQFEAMLVVNGQRHTAWTSAEKGAADFFEYELRTRHAAQQGAEKSYINTAELFVRSTGYATASKPIQIEGDFTKVNIALDVGRRGAVRARVRWRNSTRSL